MGVDIARLPIFLGFFHYNCVTPIIITIQNQNTTFLCNFYELTRNLFVTVY